MGWDGAVWGRLELPPEQTEAWLAQVVRPEDFPGWPDFFQVEGQPRSVEALFSELESLAIATPGFLELRRHENRAEVQGFLDKDALLDARLALSLPFLAAARFQAKGELMVMGARTAWFGYRLTVGDGQSHWKVLTDDEIHAAERSPEYQGIDARLETVLESLVGSTGERRGQNPFLPPAALPRTRKPSTRKKPGRTASKKSPRAAAKPAPTRKRTAPAGRKGPKAPKGKPTRSRR